MHKVKMRDFEQSCDARRAHLIGRLSHAAFFAISPLVLISSTACADTLTESARVQPQSIASTLSIVSDPANQKPEPATVRMTLKSGAHFEGYVASCATNLGTCNVIDGDGTTTLVREDEISAISILNPGSAKLALQGGNVYREAHDEVPTKLELSRRAKSISEGVSTIVQLDLTASQLESADCRFATGKVLTAVEKALRNIVDDEAGRKALRKFPEGILLAELKGTPLSVKAAPQQLVLQFDCDAPIASNLEASILQNFLGNL